MTHSEFKEAPPLYGWAIAIAAGALMFGVSLVVIGIDGNGSVAIGAVVALIVGLIFTLAEGKPKKASSAHVDTPEVATSTAAPADPVAKAAATSSGTASTSAAASTAAASTAAASTAAASSPATATGASSAAASAPATSDVETAPLEAPKPAAVAPAPEPTPDPAAPASAEVAPAQPKGLDAPNGDKDDLKRISGVGPVLEGKLNGLGFFHFWQIAKWTRAEVDWVDSYLSFKGRIDRDNWISQASKLAEESPSKPPA